MMRFLTVVYFVLSILYGTEAMRCFECNDLPNLEDCELVRQCDSHEICYVEQVVTISGHVIFNSGCRTKHNCGILAGRSVMVPGNSTQTGDQAGTIAKRSDFTVCEECCNTEFCNNKGCRETVTPLNQRGPYCFSCQKQGGTQSCRTVKQCGRNYVCLIKKLLNAEGIVYDSNCIEKAQCDSIKQVYNSIVGKRSPEIARMSGHVSSTVREVNRDQYEVTSLSDTQEVHLCILCCETDFCNDNCIKNHGRRNIHANEKKE